MVLNKTSGRSSSKKFRKESQVHAFFISNTFISYVRLKLAKNQANAKQHPEPELLLFENYLCSSYMLSSRNNRRYSKKIRKRTSVSVFMRLYD